MTTPNVPTTIILCNEEVAGTAALVSNFDLGKIRIVRVWAIAEEDQAAHASVLTEVALGTTTDPDRYADITNDSDRTTSLVTDPDGVINSAAWVAHVARAVDFRLKTVGNAPSAAAPGTPGGSFPEHSGVLELLVNKAGSTAGRMVVGLDYYPSD